jgi:hypothetical protein
LAIPDNFADLYELPEEVLGKLRRIIAGHLPVRLEGPSRVALFLYDNGAFVVESFRPEVVDVRVVLQGKRSEVCDLLSGSASAAKPRRDEGDEGTVYDFSLNPHSYRVLGVS